MGLKGTIPLDGTTIFHAVKSLMGKSFEITVGHLVLVVAILALMAGIVAGIKFDRSRVDMVYVNNRQYVMVGLAQIPGNSDVLIPVYKDLDQVVRAIKPS